MAAKKTGKDEFDCAAAEQCLARRVKGFRYTEVTREPVPVGEDAHKVKFIPNELQAKLYWDPWSCNMVLKARQFDGNRHF